MAEAAFVGAFDSGLLDFCDAGREASPGQRGLMLLQLARPELGPDAARATPVGARDAALAGFFLRHYGARAEALAECPHCGETLQLDAPIAQFADAALTDAGPAPAMLNGRALWLRAPTAGDLAGLGPARNPDDAAAAEAELLQACLVSGGPLGEDEQAEAARLLDEIIARIDPLAEIALDLDCPSCGARWSAGFDIVEFLWRRLEDSSEALIRDIDRLARAYGWSEREILALPAARRRRYVAMAES